MIAGPTASGKSGLGLALAKACNGVVINADAMQVYRDLHVLSARPQPEEMGGIEHQLYGFIGSGDAYSVGRYIADASVHMISENIEITTWRNLGNMSNRIPVSEFID